MHDNYTEGVDEYTFKEFINEAFSELNADPNEFKTTHERVILILNELK